MIFLHRAAFLQLRHRHWLHCCLQPVVSAADPAHYAAQPVAASVSACADNKAHLGHLLIWMH